MRSMTLHELQTEQADLVAQRNSVAANVAGLIDARLLVISGLIEAAQK